MSRIEPQEGGIILSVRNLSKSYQVKRGYVFSRRVGTIRAVDGVSLDVPAGSTLGLVGESGCGKTTAGRIVARLIPADGGEVLFRGRDVLGLSGKALRDLRREIQFIFQDPLSSLNPRMSVGEIVAEPMEIHGTVPRKSLKEAAATCLEEAGLTPGFLDRFPHQLSGGQRQRVVIARALSLKPSLVVADEPVSALDVSVQAQVLNLFLHLRQKRGFSSLFISHDLAVIRNVCRDVAVMYLGRIVESGPVDEVFGSPLHPYTRGLMESAPDPARRHPGSTIPGDLPDPMDTPSGCPYHPRCPRAEDECRMILPSLEEKKPGRSAACHFAAV